VVLFDLSEGIDPDRTAVYIRRSTEEQQDEHQRADVAAWLEEREIAIGDVTLYVDTESGSSATREQFLELQEAIERDEYDALVIWELSRLAREPEIAEPFFASCERHGVDIYITDGMLPGIPSEYGLIRAFASFGVHMARQERERLISRTRSGQRRAREEGKWLGEVPVGFHRSDDGYLRPTLSPDYDAGETGFFDVGLAIERLDDGESYRSVARDTPNVTRQTLATIHKSDERRRWYLEQSAADDRVDDALRGVRWSSDEEGENGR
jgi:DNA invertase Pin-like site-specific DNA recombinase